MDLIIHPFSVDSCSIFCAWKRKKKIGLRRFSVSTQLLCYLSLETQQEKKGFVTHSIATSKRERLEPSALIMQQVVRMRPSSALFVLCVHLMYTYTSEGVRECVYVCVFNV